MELATEGTARRAEQQTKRKDLETKASEYASRLADTQSEGTEENQNANLTRAPCFVCFVCLFVCFIDLKKS